MASSTQALKASFSLRGLTSWQRLAAVTLLGVFFAQAVTTVPQLSLTADEPVYMGAGYAFLRTGDLRMATSAQHPPLMQELVAIPLLSQPGPDLNTLDGWGTAEMARFAPAFVAWYGDALEAATFVARMPIVAIGVLWAAFLFRWAADWFGSWAGLVALTLFTFDPNILAHATLATNDIGFAAFSFIALFSVMRFVRHHRARGGRLPRSSWRYLTIAGLAVGAGLSSKSSGFFTALVLFTLLPLTALVGGNGRARRIGRAVLQVLFTLLLGVFVLWATYGFELQPFPLATQWEVWREMQEHLTSGHTGYLMGQIRDTGWLGYYPLAFLLKTPLFTLALLAIGLAVAVAAGPQCWLAMLPLWIFLGGYVAAILLSTVTIGYRFLLPILPFGFILVAGLFREEASWLRPPVLRWGSWVGLVVLGVSVTARVHPHYLTFFNLLAGGPTRGHRYLVDSNLDWGQSFKALRALLDERGIEQVWLSHYTYADPALYGVRYRPIPPSSGGSSVLRARFNPAPGVYAIGATTLQGVMVVDPDMYSWFRQRQPLARPGNAVLVYDVQDQNLRPNWLAQCTVPVAPLTRQVVTEGFGRDDLRVSYFDCTQSWLIPTGGRVPGAYALHRSVALGGDAFIERRVDVARLSYEQRVDRSSPAFVIYELPAAPLQAGCSAEPLSLNGPLSFLGQTVPDRPVHPGDTIEIETCWQVTALPLRSEPNEGQRPLSLMLHLVGPEGIPLAVGDGLGVPLESWQIGDLIIQRHRLSLPAEAPTGDYSVYTGAYWLDTLERWQVLKNAKPAGDRIELAAVEVVASR